MYRDLGFLRVWAHSRTARLRPGDRRARRTHTSSTPTCRSSPTCPRRATCSTSTASTFPDQSRPYGSGRLPDSDDVLAKWMALTGDERRLIATANMHLPGRQVDPEQVRRDLWRLSQWERAPHATAPVARPRRRQRGPRRLGDGPLRVPGVITPAVDPKHRSRALTEGPERAAARA